MKLAWSDLPCREADVVVVGAGLAGLTAALEATRRSVLLVSKSACAAGGSTVYAQGGIAAAVGTDDTPELHAADTVAAGDGLCHEAVVRQVAADGPPRLAALLAAGVRFDRAHDGRLALGREGAHSRRRIAHAAGDATGAELARALGEQVRETARIELAEHRLAVALAVAGDRIHGVLTAGREGDWLLLRARDVILATGGIGGLYRRTTNPPESIGDGIALAAAAGARLANLEMVQFHPTALATGGYRLPLVTEAMRGEGATLLDDRGERFMPAVHPLAELAPRDVVARAIWRRLRDGRQVVLDATGLGPRLEQRFPTVVGLCRTHGVDPRSEPIPVTPAAHYHMGGILVDAVGRTSLPGLWACGEVACSGLHGANRLASNSLLEAAVFGARVGAALCATGPAPVALPGGQVEVATRPWLAAGEPATEVAAAVRDLMWRGVGLERDAAGLARVLGELAGFRPEGRGELAAMLEVARLVTRAATLRTESRGAHHRTDFPAASSCWAQDLVFEGCRPCDPHPVPAGASAAG